MAGCGFSPRPIHEQMAHCLGGRGEEMFPVLPRVISVAEQPQIYFVNQGGWLQGLTGRLLGQFESGQLSQLVVHEGKQLLGGLRVTLLNSIKDDGHVTHGSAACPALVISSGFAARQYLRAPLREQAQRALPSGAKATDCTPISLPRAGFT